jgi:phage terminase small subunit
MAGVKGRSGGARPNSGPKPKEPVYLPLSTVYDDPDKFLKAVMNDSGTDAKLRVDAAKALLSAQVRRAENGGKKQKQADAAKKVAGGKFAAATPPKLVAAGGKKV